MIADPSRLSIQVAVDNISVGPDVSVSLGLIVTELVINALKHAFPEEMTGTIAVGYSSSGSDWTLSATGNSIGLLGAQLPKRDWGLGLSRHWQEIWLARSR